MKVLQKAIILGSIVTHPVSISHALTLDELQCIDKRKTTVVTGSGFNERTQAIILKPGATKRDKQKFTFISDAIGLLRISKNSKKYEIGDEVIIGLSNGRKNSNAVLSNIHVCGDGIVTDPCEECDDGNTQDEDGCSITCQKEGGGGEVPRPDVSNTGPRLSPTLYMGSELNLTETRLQQLASQHPENFSKQSGQWIISRVHVDGQFIFGQSTPSVIIRDCTFDAGNGLPPSSQNCLSGGAGHFVEYSRLEGSTSPAFNGNGWTFEHCHFTETSQHGFQGGYNNKFRFNLFDYLGVWDGKSDYPHSESGIVFQGNNFVFQYNNVDLPYPMPEGYAQATSCILFQADISNGNGNGIRNVNVEGNWFNCGGHMVYMMEVGAVIENFELIGNHFSANYQYSQLQTNIDYVSDPTVTVSGNDGYDPESGTTGGPVEFQQE